MKHLSIDDIRGSTYKDLIETLRQDCNDITNDSELRVNLNGLYHHGESYIVCMIELINYQKLLRLNFRNNKVIERNSITDLLLFTRYINVILWRLESRNRFGDRDSDKPFGYFVDQFYEQFPYLIQNNIEPRLNHQDQRIMKLEQYQASILDKLHVFTEILDNLDSSNVANNRLTKEITTKVDDVIKSLEL